jgi:tetratricopeptide (TPR) repeat protein
VLRAQGDGAAALAAYRAGMAIAERLAAADPGNVEWQRDLSGSHSRIGDVLMAQADLAAALAAYRASHAIIVRLAAADPGNAEWRRDLIVWCVKLADAAPDEARIRIGRALGIAETLARTGHLAERDAWMPEDLRRRLRALDTRSSSAAAEMPISRARAALTEDDIARARRILEAEPLSPMVANALAVCDMRQGEPLKAADRLRRIVATPDGKGPRENPLAAWVRNYATALLLCGDVKGCRRVLGWNREHQDIRAERIEAAAEAYTDSLSFGQRMGLAAKPPVTLGFEPGEL